MTVFTFIIILVVLVAISVIILYNSLIKKKNTIENAFFSVDVMLKKRYELIPQLVETVKGYMYHEKNILSNLTLLRQKAMEGNRNTNEKVDLDNQINSALQSIIVNFENYPQLKASDNFLKLQAAINESEEQLAAARRFYNAAVTDYHNGIETFPSSLVASWMKLKHKNLFSISDVQRQVPEITI